MKQTFAQLLKKEKEKLPELKKWHSYIHGKDIAHKNKKQYSRKKNKGFGYDGESLYFFNRIWSLLGWSL